MKKYFILGAALCFLSTSAFAEEIGLEESVNLALEHHETIKSATANKERTRHQLSAARRAAGLRIGWAAGARRIGGGYYSSYRHSYNPGNYNIFTDRYEKSNDPYTNEFTNRFTAQFPLYSGGQLEGQMKSAGFQSAAADLTLERARQNIRFETKQAYYNLLRQENLVNIAESASKMAKEKLQLIQIQYEEGSLPKADVLQIEVQLASYNQDLTSAQGSYTVAMNQLARLIGKEGEFLILKDKLSYEPFPYTLEEAETFAGENRPDKLVGALGVKQAEAEVNAEQSGFKPQVNAVYERSISDNKAFLRDGRTETWAAGVDVSWNVFDNSITQARVDAAKANVTRAKAEEANINKNLLLEIRSAYAQMKTAEANIKTSQVAVSQARESYEIAGVRYEEGVDSLLSLTTAQERLIRAETNYYSALYNYNLYKAQLERAIGIPVLINVEAYKKTLSNNPKSAANLDKIENSAMVKK